MKKLMCKKTCAGSKEEQLYILMLFRNYKRLSKRKQDVLKRILQESISWNHEALFMYLTTGHSLQYVMSKYYIASHATIYRGMDKMFELAVREDELWQ